MHTVVYLDSSFGCRNYLQHAEFIKFEEWNEIEESQSNVYFIFKHGVQIRHAKGPRHLPQLYIFGFYDAEKGELVMNFVNKNFVCLFAQPYNQSWNNALSAFTRLHRVVRFCGWI